MTTPIREGMLKWIGDRKVLFDNLPASTPLCLKTSKFHGADPHSGAFLERMFVPVLYRSPDDGEDTQRVFISAVHVRLALDVAISAIDMVSEDFDGHEAEEDLAEAFVDFSTWTTTQKILKKPCSRDAYDWIAFVASHLGMAILRHLIRGEPFEILGMGVHQCSGCGVHRNETTLRACGGCGCVRYCSTACQKKDWREHKKVCRGMGECAAGVEQLERRTIWDLADDLKSRIEVVVN